MTVTTPGGTTGPQTFTYVAAAPAPAPAPAPAATGPAAAPVSISAGTTGTTNGVGFGFGATSVTDTGVESLPPTGAPNTLPLVLALFLLASGALLVVGAVVALGLRKR